MALIYNRIAAVFRRFLFFFVSLAMCFSSFAIPEYREPAFKNSGTGECFLPDYGKPLVAAHRIGRSIAPENTLLAVEKNLALDEPPDILEMDVQITSDSELVLYHSLYLDENSDAAEFFGKKNITVFSKTYEELRQLNMGEKWEQLGKYPYAGLRGDDIPEDLRLARLEDVLDFVEGESPGAYRYVIEIKYPAPWMPKMVDGLYKLLSERGMTDRVILSSFWPGFAEYVDLRYSGKLLRSADPLEVIDFYGCYKRNTDLSREKIPYMALIIPFYWKDERLLVANFGRTGFIDYAHKYGSSVQYWTVSKTEDIILLCKNGADVIMTNHVQRAYQAIENTVFNQSGGQ